MGGRSKHKPKPRPPALPLLKQMLAETKDGPLLRMFWAIDAIQDDREEHARGLLRYPPEAATSDILSKYAAHKWDLETLIAVLLNNPKSIWSARALNIRTYDALAMLVNHLRRAEEDEHRDRLNNDNILIEVHRIGHRQFQWQRGWRRPQDFYRHLFIYGQGICADYFQKTYGISVIDFVSVSFVVFGMMIGSPWMANPRGLRIIDLDDKLLDIVIPMLSGEIADLRTASAKMTSDIETGLGASLPIAYQPSYLRLKPIIQLRSESGRYIAPLPDLILMRVTVGLFYDLVSGGTTVTNDAANRFEEYAQKVIKALCPGFDPLPAAKYTFNKNPVDTPDVLLKHGKKIVAVFECKATKLTFQAQYGDDPVNDSKTGYEQMAKAIFQLWKFFSHVRRKLVELDVADDAVGVVLTMEPWTQMGGPLRERLISAAKDLAAQKDPLITEEDMRPPVFCAIQDLEEMLVSSTEEQLLQAFRVATTEKYRSWGVREVREAEVPAIDKRKDFPFSVGDFLPWWSKLKVAGKAAREAKAKP
ncbi:hypothetical protein HFO17_18890 [Rhizobium laguerreae]|uniref:hypothetical protein n=1 Tax=Rhizobium laguerreae TaxID=1076926 RepID=UPI001C926B5A|nr:hypothetical protein [Rhizobium laguerreae]MBY3236582.1 hypothetical protein [Rhizobium laguerreae]